MHPICPLCTSHQVDTLDHARKTGGVVGALAGAAVGATRLAGRPPGMVIGGLAGAIIAGMLGGTAGCLAGAKFGEALDHQVLANYRCLACGHRFSLGRSAMGDVATPLS